MFISFEGVDGSGKTTQAKLLVEHLSKKNIKCIYTQEPGSTPVGKKVRQMLLENNLDSVSELFLLLAARKEHLSSVILPALKSNIWVICDRFIDSTLCYQGILKSVGLDIICKLHKEFMDIWPSVTLLLNVEKSLCIQRIKSRPYINNYDEMIIKNYKTIKEAFLLVAKKFPERIVTIDANCEPHSIHKNILKTLNQL